PPLMYPLYLLDDLKEGTGAVYRTLTTSAESRANPEPVGRIDDVFVTYLGDVAKLQADHSYTDLPMEDCSAWDRGDESGKDAVFRFSVTNPDTYFFSGRG